MDVDLRAFEREQVDTVFEGRSGYPDLTTAGGLSYGQRCAELACESGADARTTGREHHEFATRTYPHPDGAPDPDRCVMGASDLAVQNREYDGHGPDYGYGSRVVPGDLGRDDDCDDVSCGSPDDPGFRTGPAWPASWRVGPFAPRWP